MSPLTYTLEQLQEALQESSLDATRNRITLLEGKHGFPPRLPGFTARWSRPAIDQWFLTWGGHVAVSLGEPEIAQLKSTLEKAYG